MERIVQKRLSVNSNMHIRHAESSAEFFFPFKMLCWKYTTSLPPASLGGSPMKLPSVPGSLTKTIIWGLKSGDNHRGAKVMGAHKIPVAYRPHAMLELLSNTTKPCNIDKISLKFPKHYPTPIN